MEAVLSSVASVCLPASRVRTIYWQRHHRHLRKTTAVQHTKAVSANRTGSRQPHAHVHGQLVHRTDVRTDRHRAQGCSCCSLHVLAYTRTPECTHARTHTHAYMHAYPHAHLLGTAALCQPHAHAVCTARAHRKCPLTQKGAASHTQRWPLARRACVR